MKKNALLGWAAIALLVGATSCAKDPESFCEGWAADTCEAITGCCESGSKFDPDQCRIDLSRSCQTIVDVEAIHAGEVEFHSGAASDCFGAIETCKDIQTEVEEFAYDRQLACLSMLSGFRPVGAACNKSNQCEADGEYPYCFPGFGYSDSGVCVDVVTDDEGCSFSFETNELHICGEGKYCDTSSWEPPSSATPASRAFEFKGSCKSLAGNGASCMDKNQHTIPCASGLYCDYVGSDEAKCAKRKSAGTACDSTDECAVGLDCGPDPSGPGLICQKADGPYCFKPAVCGNGDCESTEDETSCPSDCGVSPGSCGDGYCDLGEGANCPLDCCGDGNCDPGEDLVCPSDCGL